MATVLKCIGINNVYVFKKNASFLSVLVSTTTLSNQMTLLRILCILCKFFVNTEFIFIILFLSKAKDIGDILYFKACSLFKKA